MEPLRELLAIDERRALEFFVTGLKDVCEPGVDAQQLLYNASVLAHYALVSTQSGGDLPAPASLADVFDHFILDASLRQDGEMLETAGAQCLLLAGFFEAQMRRRHSIRWYADLGSAFFGRAAERERAPKKARLLETLSLEFEPWRRRHARLSRELREQQYLLSLPTPPPLM